MILLSELSRRRIRSIQKLIRVGRNEVVVVLRVDREKGAFMVLLFNRFSRGGQRQPLVLVLDRVLYIMLGPRLTLGSEARS
jgi:hypothetical protein